MRPRVSLKAIKRMKSNQLITEPEKMISSYFRFEVYIVSLDVQL